MYRRIAVPLWGEKLWVTARGVRASAGTLRYWGRNTDLPCRLLRTGTTLLHDKPEPPENVAIAKQEEETKDKPSEQSLKDSLLHMIGGMKVDITSKRRLIDAKAKGQSPQLIENLESASSMFQTATEESQTESSRPLNPDLVAAVTDVAASLPLNKTEVEFDLLQQLRKHEQETEVQRKAENPLSDLISTMKIGKSPRSTQSSWQSNKMNLGSEEFKSVSITEELSMRSRRGLYTMRRLNIFPVIAEAEKPTGTELSLWDVELANQIASTCEQPPRNGFEEMIQWTKEGKLWTFPINNEAGLDEEQDVEFHEHIFLDKYLEDFPKQGPIRHFMELVVCGLSKNPYIGVKEKKDHVEWFRDYFEQKKDVLTNCDIYVH